MFAPGLTAHRVKPLTGSCCGSMSGAHRASSIVLLNAGGRVMRDGILDLGRGPRWLLNWVVCTDWRHLYGFPSEFEVWNASGIGVAGAHWIPVRNDPMPATRVGTMPFGRPKDQGY